MSNPEDIQLLIEMGFSSDVVKKALQVTNNKGVEPAMEWLLAHSDDAGGTNQQMQTDSGPEKNTDNAGDSSSSTTTTTTEIKSDENSTADTAEVKSLQCDVCNRLCANYAEVQRHTEVTGHSAFSESTVEKPKLTEAERKEQLQKLEEKIKQKRVEREQLEKQTDMERERLRIKSGKDLTEARRRMEDIEMKKILDARKREKESDRLARQRVRDQIEADKQARRLRAPQSSNATTISTDESSASQETSIIPSTAVNVSSIDSTTIVHEQDNKKIKDKNYVNTQIQVRLRNGEVITETFGVHEELSAVRLFIQMKSTTELPFGLMTTYPRKLFTDDDFEKPLILLDLVPSAVLTVTKG